MMKIILLKDNKDLGKKGSLLEAKDGYARNYLIPRKIAIEATEENILKWKEQKKLEEEQEKQNKEEALRLKKKLESTKIKIFTKAGEGGRLFGAITSKDIADEIEKTYKVKIDRKKIDLSENIKTIGSRTIDVKLYPQIIAQVKVEIDSE